MNKSYLIGALLAAVALLALYSQHENTSKPSSSSFKEFKVSHHKVYSREGEEEYRKTVFQQNLVKIEKHNADSTNTWSMEVNQFSDLTEAEFAALYLTLKVPQKDVKVEESRMLSSNLKGGAVDWVAAGKVTFVKDQGMCGACWAFAVTGAIESACLVQSGGTGILSEQDLVDCSGYYGNRGCEGGWMEAAFEYIVTEGISTENDYPYTGKDGTCLNKQKYLKLHNYQNIVGCTAMENSLSSTPVSVAVDATLWGNYAGGILSKCGTAMNHGVLLVGTNDNYWTIKNSWGSSWGENGYIRLAKGNTCAICSYPSYPIL